MDIDFVALSLYQLSSGNKTLFPKHATCIHWCIYRRYWSLVQISRSSSLRRISFLAWSRFLYFIVLIPCCPVLGYLFFYCSVPCFYKKCSSTLMPQTQSSALSTENLAIELLKKLVPIKMLQTSLSPSYPPSCSTPKSCQFYIWSFAHAQIFYLKLQQ